MGTGDTKKKRKKEKREKSQAPLSALVGGQVTRSKSTMRIAFRTGGERKKNHIKCIFAGGHKGIHVCSSNFLAADFLIPKKKMQRKVRCCAIFATECAKTQTK